MIDKSPRAELTEFRGGADAWDDGPAGALLTLEFFGDAAESISAQLEQALPLPGLVAAGTVAGAGISASLNATLARPALAGAAVARVGGSLSASLLAPGLTATCGVRGTAGLSASLPLPAVVCTGAVRSGAALAASLPLLGLEAAGTLGSPAIDGALVAQLPAPALGAASSVRVSGEASNVLQLPGLEARARRRIDIQPQPSTPGRSTPGPESRLPAVTGERGATVAGQRVRTSTSGRIPSTGSKRRA